MSDQYITWQSDPTPENLNLVVDSLSPTITSEIQRYRGPKALLRGQAKLLTIKAVKNYDPTQGAALSSWVVSQLQPLNRYSHKLKPISTPELQSRKAAEINESNKRLTAELGRTPTDIELADYIGISPKKINKIREQIKPVLATSQLDTSDITDNNPVEPTLVNVATIGTAKDMVYNSLPVKYKFVFDHKTGIGGEVLSNQEIAKQLGITPSMVSQMSSDIANRIIKVNKNVI